MNAQPFPDVVVNGELVPKIRIAAEVQNHPVPKDKPGFAWKAAAQALVVKTLLLQEARQRGLSALPEDLGMGRRESDEDALIRALIEAETPSRSPSEAEIHAIWLRDPDRYRSPPLWETSHILCACDPQDTAARAMAHARAVKLVARLLEGQESFARVAAQESDCGSRGAGGALGQVGPGDTVPEFEAALRRLAEGEMTTEPVLSQFGWHIIRLDAVAEGRVLPYETARPMIAEALEKRAWAQAARDLVARLVTRADISGISLV